MIPFRSLSIASSIPSEESIDDLLPPNAKPTVTQYTKEPSQWTLLQQKFPSGKASSSSFSSRISEGKRKEVKQNVPSYEPPVRPMKIRAQDILDPNLRLDGDVITPTQLHFSKIFPWKAIQLRIAMKYGSKLKELSSKRWGSVDAIAYSEATDKLTSLHNRAMEIDMVNYAIEDKGGPHIAPINYLTALDRAPHFRFEEVQYQPIERCFEEDAEALLITANNLGFTVVK